MHNLIYLPFSSLEEVWVTVLNITGPLSSWSFADNVLAGMKTVSSTEFLFWVDNMFPLPDVFCICTGTETHGGGPQSYILRLSGPSDGNWTFWLEVKFDAVFNFLYNKGIFGLIEWRGTQWYPFHHIPLLTPFCISFNLGRMG